MHTRQQLLERLARLAVPERIVAAFAAVPRERFLSPPARPEEAYEDRALEIGEGQTISQPYIIAMMLKELDLRGDERVLDVGTGSGYQAALLGQLCREVYSIEIRPQLLARAQETLAALRYANVHCTLGDGREGWPAHAPYDAVIVAAASDQAPPPLIEQLKVGGRIVMPLGPKDMPFQVLCFARKEPNGLLTSWSGDMCKFVPLV